jgi:hypothetical protein
MPDKDVDLPRCSRPSSQCYLSFPGMTGIGFGSPTVALNIQFGPGGPSSTTPIQPHKDTSATTLESLLEALVQHAGSEIWKPQIILGGADGVRSFWKHVELGFQEPFVILQPLSRISIPKIAFDLGLHISQKHLKFDRGAKYAFVLAVEDRVRGVTKSAVRPVGDSRTSLASITTEEPDPKMGPILENGSVMAVWLRPFFDFNDLAGLKNGEFKDEIEKIEGSP